METEVQSKMYLPGCYLMRDLNDNVGSGSWPSHLENKTLKNGQYHDIFLIRPAIDGYAGNDREQLRQTILKHESMFRHQLHELHHLYKTQRDLMNEIKSKELHKHQIPAGASQSSLYSYGFPSENDKERWHISHLPKLDFNCGTPSMSGVESIQSHFSSMNGKLMQSTSGPAQNGVRLKDYESLEFKCNTLQRRLFDIEVPAGEYINSEVEGQGVNGTCGRDGNLSNRSGLADLNEPVQLEEASASASVEILGNITYSKENARGQDLSANSYLGFQCCAKEFPQDSHRVRDGGVSLGSMHLGNERRQKGWLSYNFEVGQTGSSKSSFNGFFHPEDVSMRCESAQVEPVKAHDPATFFSSAQIKTEQLKRRKIFGVEISESNFDASVVVSQKLGAVVPRSDVANSESSSISPWKKLPISLNQNVTMIEENSCLSTSAQSNKSSITSMHSPEVVGDMLPVNSRGLGRMDVKSAKDIRTNAVPLKRYQNEMKSQSNLVSVDGPRKQENLQGGLSWLCSMPLCNGKSPKEREGCYQMNLDSLQNYSHQFFNKAEMRKGPSQIFIQDSLSATHANDAEHRRTEVGDCSSSRKLLGFPIFEKPHVSKDFPSLSSQSKPSSLAFAIDVANSMKVELHNSGSATNSRSPKSGEQWKVENLVVEKGLVDHGAGLRHHIDLNLCAIEEDAEPTLSSPRTNVKIAVAIDLEAPVVETELDLTPGGESPESKLKEPVDLSPDESREPQEELIKVVAEALVAISAYCEHNLQDTATCHQMEVSPNDPLQWFAEIISSVDEDSACHEETIPDGLDYFEFVTLNLTETKVEEYHYKPQVLENTKDGNILTRRPRRGQARRGRQRKDFQRDILPTLTSLSRNEVTDDLQTIEGLICATGGTWQSSLTRRRNAKSGSGRGGRRRLGGSTSPPTVTTVCQPQIQQSECKELGLGERSLTGWGKRTRRPPRQRCPISNPPPS